MRNTRIPAMWYALLLAPSVVFTLAVGRQQTERDTAPVPVRYAEGMVHGFLELRTASDSLLAHGDLLQVPTDSGVESRLVFHFPDSSLFEETVRFTQRQVFQLDHYRLVQRGPVFEHDLDVTLDRSGRYDVNARPRDGGAPKHYSGSLELPPDVYNGMVITIAKNLSGREVERVHLVAFTPKPMLVGLELEPSGTEHVLLGTHRPAVRRYTLKPKLGAVRRAVATVIGQAPPDSHVWIVTEGVPAFVRFEGPMYSGPVWRLSLTSPRWPT